MSAKDERPLFVGADADGSVGLELLEDDAGAGAGALPQGFDMVGLHAAADFGSTGGTPPASPLGGPAPVPLCT